MWENDSAIHYTVTVCLRVRVCVCVSTVGDFSSVLDHGNDHFFSCYCYFKNFVNSTNISTIIKRIQAHIQTHA